ncbi:MBL fold metallo-hydrolase [Gaiella sp.]|uniref:MBL fold metallo-hydrolase n=1 Tax=Gaiella sp. TaxID=2663207 RepID=UPI00326317F0
MTTRPWAPIDLLHQGNPRSVGVYLVETDDGLALFDCGPTTALPALRVGLAARGYELGEIRHLLLSHIHFDHAGAAGAIVRENPSVLVHVSAVGAPHLVDPTRLEASARRLYGDTFDALWGELVAVPEANVRVVGERVVGLACFPSTGHASHHVSMLHEDGTLYAGDSVGVRIEPARFVLAPTPPPDIDLEAWEETLKETGRREPTRLALTHFGIFEDVSEHLARMRETLHTWSERVAHGMDEATFVAAGRADCLASDPDQVEDYDHAAPYSQCFLGLERYWRKRLEAAP